MSWEDAEREVKRHKEWQIKSREKSLRGEKAFYLQDFWAERDGFDDIDIWIEQLDMPDKIEAYRTALSVELAKIQTKEFECMLETFYVGDEVPKYSGPYFIPEEFECDGCSTADEHVYVKVWLEIEERKLKAVLTYDHETGKPSQEILEHRQLKPRFLILIHLYTSIIAASRLMQNIIQKHRNTIWKSIIFPRVLLFHIRIKNYCA
jgi:hypothetical protein